MIERVVVLVVAKVANLIRDYLDAGCGGCKESMLTYKPRVLESR